MTDHSSHNHPATPAARRACRNDLRNDVANLQSEYMAIDLADDVAFARAEYRAGVELFSIKWDLELNAAFDLIER